MCGFNVSFIWIVVVAAEFAYYVGNADGAFNTGAIVTELIGRTITRTYNDNFITIIYNMNV